MTQIFTITGFVFLYVLFLFLVVFIISFLAYHFYRSRFFGTIALASELYMKMKDPQKKYFFIADITELIKKYE